VTDREHLSGQVDLLDQRSVVHQRSGAVGEGLVEERDDRDSGEQVDGEEFDPRVHAQEDADGDEEHHELHERLDVRPQPAQHRTAVADLHFLAHDQRQQVATTEHVEQSEVASGAGQRGRLGQGA
jgi:hypothetical protein